MANQNLFDLMSRDHGLSLLESEMKDIKEAIRKDDEEMPRPDATGCPFCGSGSYYPTNIKKNKTVTSCANSKCPIFGVDMTIKQWESATR